MTALCRAVIPGLPSLPADLIERPALWARLDQGVQCPLTLVVAPGGYGKTSAVATWLARRQPDWKEREAVWYTVDSLDAPPSSFLAQVVSAIQAGFPGSCGQTCQMLEKAPISPIEQLAIQLAQDITALPKGLVLVLDDCDKVEQTATLGWLETLVRHASPALSLVWISRCDPPFSVARLRSQSRLVELRLADLQLSTAEVQSVLETHMSEPVPPALAEKLTAHLEGWGCRSASADFVAADGRRTCPVSEAPGSAATAPNFREFHRRGAGQPSDGDSILSVVQLPASLSAPRALCRCLEA